jgi:hypothetical protein
MNYNSKINKQKSTLEKLVTDRYKKRIKELGLIDTGETLKSLKCSIKFTPDGFSLVVDSTDYFKYIDSEYGISDYVIIQKDVDELIKDLFADIIFSELL